MFKPKREKMILEDKTAIVTGSSKGLGRGFAKGLAAEGAQVIVNGTNAEDVARVVDEILQNGGRAGGCVETVETMEGAKRIVQSALDKFGGLDILVNNAGNLRDRSFLKMAEDDWDSVIAVHLKGTFACCQSAAKIMKNQMSGRIINITSAAGFRGNFGQSNYAAAKAGILGFTFTLARELARYNITVNAVWPRAITRMTRPIMEQRLQVSKKQAEESLTAVPSLLDLGFGEPNMVAPLVVYLSSDEARDISGKIFAGRGEVISAWSAPKEVVSATMAGGWTVEAVRKRFRTIFADVLVP
jgi:3-oxoacyl-[acyl-carrier protein] reductase